MTSMVFQFQVWKLSDDNTTYHRASIKIFSEDELCAAHELRESIPQERCASVCHVDVRPKLAKVKNLLGQANPLPLLCKMAEEPANKLPDFVLGTITAAFWTADPTPGQGEYQFDENDYNQLEKIEKLRLIIAATEFEEENASEIQMAIQLKQCDGGFRSKRGESYSEHQAGIDYYLTAIDSGSGFANRGRHEVWEMLHRKAKKSGVPELYFVCETHGECNGPGNCDSCDNRNGKFTVM